MSVVITITVASAFRAGVVVPRTLGVDLDRHRLRRRVRRQVVGDDEVVDREREDDHQAREDRRREQRQQHEPQRAERRCAEIARRFLVLRADREQPAAHDEHDVRDRERHLPEHLRGRAELDLVERHEDEQQRHRHHDLGRDEREQHQEVHRPRAVAAPARQPDRQADAERHGDQHVEPRQLQALLEGAAHRRIVEDRLVRVAPVPAGREALPDAARATVVEREQDRDHDGYDRPHHVAPT